MSTARDFCTLVLKEAGVVGVGQTALAEDINDTFTLLNRMFAQWQKKRWLIPSLYEIAAIGNNNKSNLIGPGQYYNAPRPDKIQSAYFIQLNGSSDPNSLVSFPLTAIWSWEDYSRIALKQLNSWPLYFFYDGAFPYGNVYIWPIPSSTYEIHLVCKSPIGFTVEIEAGDITKTGSLYTNGVYPGTALVSLTGFGSGGTLDITVTGGIVTQAIVNNGGDGYKINDQLTAIIPGTGNGGFIFTVTNVTSDLDAEFNMPPEYEEAIHYNLTRRGFSQFKVITAELRQDRIS